ncbi:twin-arginine translocation pathway signal [Rhodovulum sp. 12E13]|uniref:lipid-binding SYLF domain-containing protein n=1 Tax=Rhodovulum sp. 12E13 TaxID=2203891 RepID=UPI000E15F596|nr:YSC84-related protein [Rhodovulum sp. 12E13]RDC74431.1 twin-arginine translocation pathway signal [Rhodovulum sp. 12E13]
MAILPNAGCRPTRRAFLASAGAGAATLALAGCNNGIGSNGAARIDARVDETRRFLFQTYPATERLESDSAGQLYMPLVTEAGLGIGGSYGTGALRINGATVDYYAAFTATLGLQAGAQQYAHALFFMTPEALRRFRTSSGWSAGAEAEYATLDRGGNISADTLTAIDPVIALVFAQTGLIAGANLQGTKYQRIIP